MKKIVFILIVGLLAGCDEPASNNTSYSPPTGESPVESHPITSDTDQRSDDHKKSDGEIALEATGLALNAIGDIVDRQRIKDSLREAGKGSLFAYQIGLKMREKEAFSNYQKLIEAGVPSVYVFRTGRKEMYMVQFEAKGQEELNLAMGDFKRRLGELGSEGIKIINLNDFCGRKETVSKYTVTDEGTEINCLNCE